MTYDNSIRHEINGERRGRYSVIYSEISIENRSIDNSLAIPEKMNIPPKTYDNIFFDKITSIYIVYLSSNSPS
jgi:hypothetical protein